MRDREPMPLLHFSTLIWGLALCAAALGNGGVSPNLITGTNWALVFQTEQQMFFRLSPSP
jgi:hypothetical protein